MTDIPTFEAVLTDHTALISDMSVDGYVAYCACVARLVNEGTGHSLSGAALRAYVNTRLKGLTEPQPAFLHAEAKRLGISVGELITRIIDEYRTNFS